MKYILPSHIFEVIDLFCGAGGVTTGIEAARFKRQKIAKVIACINHDPVAIESHAANHRGVLHFIEDIKTFDVTRFPAWSLNTITCLWASLECTNFSKAKGGKPRDADSRTLANYMFKYIGHLNPNYFFVENVEEFQSWGPLDSAGKPLSRDNGRYYRAWCNKIEAMGYEQVDPRKLNAADFGANTIRKRLFLIFRQKGFPIAWPQPTHSKTPDMYIKKPWQPVKDCLDFNDEGNSIFTRKKALSERTLERIYAGLVKFIADGDTQWILKYNSVNGKTGKHVPPSVEEPSPALNTHGRLGLVSANKAFLAKSYSGRPKGKVIPIEGPAGAITTVDHHSLVESQFLINYNHGLRTESLKRPLPTLTTSNRFGKVETEFLINYNHSSKSESIKDPSRSILTKDRYAKIKPDFLYSYISDAPRSVDDTFYTLTTQPQHAKVKVDFLIKYHGTGNNLVKLEDPCSTLSTKDRLAKISPEFFMDIQFSNGQRNQSIQKPLGSILSNPKQRLVRVEKAFLLDPNYNNIGSPVGDPSPPILASRRHRYIVNPHWFNNGLSSVDKPSPTLIARMDKTPPYLVTTESGEVAIEIYEKDSEGMVKIKLFMAAYGIVDIKMRMLKVPELLKIQGFPKKYKLLGTQSDKKKFIGNSVVPVVAQRIIEALYKENYLNYKKAA